MKKRIIYYPFLILSAIILGLSRESLMMSFFSFISIIPLIYVCSFEKSLMAGFSSGLVYGFAYNIIQVHWIINTMVNYGGLSIIEAAIVLAVLCLYLGLFWGIFGIIVNYTEKRNCPFFILPGIWVIIEYIVTYLFTGFPWTLAGYNVSKNLIIIQTLDIGGIYLLSFLLISINILIYNIIMRRSRALSIMLLILIVSSVSIYGFFRIGQLKNRYEENKKRAVLIQPNIDQGEKMDFSRRTAILNRMLDYLDEIDTEGTELVVFPETAFNTGIRDSIYFYKISEWVSRNHIPVITGTVDHVRTKDACFSFNASLFIDIDHYSFYHKNHLVPFGEYLPLSNFPILKELRNIIPADVDRGEERTFFIDKDGFTIITPICFEIIFPEEIAGWAKDKADLIITLTNDAWFGRTKASFQHFDKVAYRAVENRIPSIMLANTGVSGFVDITGKRYGMTGIFTESVVYDEINVHEQKKTIWNRIYRYNLFFYIILTAILLYAGIRKRSIE